MKENPIENTLYWLAGCFLSLLGVGLLVSGLRGNITHGFTGLIIVSAVLGVALANRHQEKIATLSNGWKSGELQKFLKANIFGITGALIMLSSQLGFYLIAFQVENLHKSLFTGSVGISLLIAFSGFALIFYQETLNKKRKRE